MIHRHYAIIRRIMRDDFPNAKILLNECRYFDKEVTMRTFQRDLVDIEANFSINIEYDRIQNGYFFDRAKINNVDRLLYFIALAESADMVIASLRNKQEITQYLSFSPAMPFKGNENIGVLLQASRDQNLVQFQYLNNSTKEQTPYTVEPYLLKEFENRWYLFARMATKNSFRTFCLDCISNMTLTDESFEKKSGAVEEFERFSDTYGLIYSPEQQVVPKEKVQLRIRAEAVLKNLEELPLHHSQKIENDTVTLNVIVNTELENKILSFGEHAEVIEPNSLKNKIIQRLKTAVQQYE